MRDTYDIKLTPKKGKPLTIQGEVWASAIRLSTVPNPGTDPERFADKLRQLLVCDDKKTKKSFHADELRLLMAFAETEGKNGFTVEKISGEDRFIIDHKIPPPPPPPSMRFLSPARG